MIHDLNVYRHNIKPIVKQRCDAKDTKPIEQIGAIALATNCDIIIVAHYVGELYGFSSELNDMIKRLKKFYKSDEVINHEENTAS